MNDEALSQRYLGDLRALLAAAALSRSAFDDYADAATSSELKRLMESGVSEDEEQVASLSDLIESAGGTPEPSTNRVVEALVASGRERVSASDDPDLVDSAVIDGLRANLHYYVAAYGAASRIAGQLGRQSDADALDRMCGHMIAKEREYGALADGAAGSGSTR